MIRENQRLLNQFNVLTDAVAVFLAMLVSYWLRFELFHGVKGMPFNYYVWLGVVAAALTLLVFAVAGLYESFRAVRFHVEAGRVAVLELLVALIVMAAMFVLRLGETSRWSVAFFYAVATLLLVGKRGALRMILRRYRAMGYNQKRVLLVGHGESAETYLERVTSDKRLGYQVVGYVADQSGWDALPYCGTYAQLEEVFEGWLSGRKELTGGDISFYNTNKVNYACGQKWFRQIGVKAEIYYDAGSVKDEAAFVSDTFDSLCGSLKSGAVGFFKLGEVDMQCFETGSELPRNERKVDDVPDAGDFSQFYDDIAWQPAGEKEALAMAYQAA